MLTAWVWWDERRRERELLHRARRCGHSLGSLGAFFGLATRQATYDHLDRLDALLEAHQADQARQDRVARARAAARQALDGVERDPDTIAGPWATASLPADDDLYRRTCGRRASAVGADPAPLRQRRRDRRGLPARERWIAEQHERIERVVSELLGQCQRLGFEPRDQDSDELELEDTLALLARHRADGQYTHSSFAALGLALGELRDTPPARELARNHGLHQAIAAADRMRAEYAALRSPPGHNSSRS